jgi:hypothetical protein
VSVIVVLDSIIEGLCDVSILSLSFARDKYIDTYIERHKERVIMWTLQSPFHKKVRVPSIVSSFLFDFNVKI